MFGARESFSLVKMCYLVLLMFSSSVHVVNEKKDILILGKELTDGLGGTTLSVEKEYSINFT